jgi:hypothetical protein
MTDTNRRFSWRQGDALTDEAASALNLQFLDNSGSTVAVVISHNCDLAAAADKEPKSEIIVGTRIDKLGGDSFGKTARR